VSAAISVDVSDLPDGWLARVRIDGGTEHEVTVRRDYLDYIALAAAPEEIVRASFEFLLDREPPGAILRRFDLAVIGRYFPEYEGEIKARFR
jgi:hypothetical protein